MLGTKKEMGKNTFPFLYSSFFRQVVRCGGIPFELKTDPFYSPENQARLQKAINDYEAGRSKPVVKTIEELEA
jgi:antitoxin component of RelBE/YafQ-DinJ toxin-antitoxin module